MTHLISIINSHSMAGILKFWKSIICFDSYLFQYVQIDHWWGIKAHPLYFGILQQKYITLLNNKGNVYFLTLIQCMEMEMWSGWTPQLYKSKYAWPRQFRECCWRWTKLCVRSLGQNYPKYIPRMIGSEYWCRIYKMHLIDILPEFLWSFMQYLNILDRVLTALD